MEARLKEERLGPSQVKIGYIPAGIYRENQFQKDELKKFRLMKKNHIRNIAIISHVDHGKTTLLNAMLKQT